MQTASDHRHTEGRVIHVGITANQENIQCVPAKTAHLAAVHREKAQFTGHCLTGFDLMDHGGQGAQTWVCLESLVLPLATLCLVGGRFGKSGRNSDVFALRLPSTSRLSPKWS